MKFWVARRNGGEVIVAIPALGNNDYRSSILVEIVLEIEKISLIAWHLSQALDKRESEAFVVKIEKDRMHIGDMIITFHLEEWEQK